MSAFFSELSNKGIVWIPEVSTHYTEKLSVHNWGMVSQPQIRTVCKLWGMFKLSSLSNNFTVDPSFFFFLDITYLVIC